MRWELVGRQPLLRRDLRLRPANDGSVVLDASRLTFASPLELAAIAALTHRAWTEGRSTALITPRDQAVTAYLQRMDVIRHLPPGTVLDGRLPSEQRAELGGSLLEVQPLRAATVADVTTRLGRFLTSQFDKTIGQALFMGIGELIDNALDHGASQAGAFVAAQAYTGATSGHRGVQLAICDTGIGVLQHLHRNPEHRHVPDAETALRRAIEPGVTGTREDRGYGLNDLLRQLRKQGVGKLTLRSGDGVAGVTFRDGRRLRIQTCPCPVDGTWAWLRIRSP